MLAMNALPISIVENMDAVVGMTVNDESVDEGVVVTPPTYIVALTNPVDARREISNH